MHDMPVFSFARSLSIIWTYDSSFGNGSPFDEAAVCLSKSIISKIHFSVLPLSLSLSLSLACSLPNAFGLRRWTEWIQVPMESMKRERKQLVRVVVPVESQLWSNLSSIFKFIPMKNAYGARTHKHTHIFDWLFSMEFPIHTLNSMIESYIYIYSSGVNGFLLSHRRIE